MKIILILFTAILVGLTTTTISYSMNPIDNLINEKKITLLSNSDGEEFTIPVTLARHSITIRQLIEDCGIDAPITLPPVSGTTLKHVVEALKTIEKDKNRLLTKNTTSHKTEVKTLIKQFKDLSQNDLKKLFLAANYLDIPSLMHATGALLGNFLINKKISIVHDKKNNSYSIEEINATLGCFIIDRLFDYTDVLTPNHIQKVKNLCAKIVNIKETKEKWQTCLKHILESNTMINKTINTLNSGFKKFTKKLGFTTKEPQHQELYEILQIVKYGNHNLIKIIFQEIEPTTINTIFKEILNPNQYAEKKKESLSSDEDQFIGEYIFIEAIKTGNVETIELMIEKLSTFSLQLLLAIDDKYGNSALSNAIKSKNIAMLNLIINYLQEFNILDQQINNHLNNISNGQKRLSCKNRINNTNLLQDACNSGNNEIVSIIWKNIERLNLSSKFLTQINKSYKKTPLILAAFSGNLEMVQFISEELQKLKILEDQLTVNYNENENILSWALKNKDDDKYKRVANYIIKLNNDFKNIKNNDIEKN